MRQSHWAFQPVLRPELPSVDHAGHAANPIDRFILARLDAAGLSPSPRADRRTLIRRAYLDLIGLPPSPVDVHNRHRTLYTYIDREKLAEIYRVFDFPSPDLSAARRPRTTVPQQSLFLLNNPFILARADALARIAVPGEAAAPADPEGVQRLYRAVLQRPAAPEEVALALDFLRPPSNPASAGEEIAAPPWSQLAQALLLSNEFMFAD